MSATTAGARRARLRDRLADGLAAHEHLAAAALLALLVVVQLFPALLGGRALLPTTGLYYEAPWIASAPADLLEYSNRGLEDVGSSLYPWNVLARQMLHAGSFPAWNPYAQAGTPFFGNIEVAWLSPFSLLLWTLPLNWALGFVAALKLWLAGFGAYLLARELRLGFWPGLLAGVAFSLCAFNVVWLSHGVQVSVAVLLPWLLLLAERVVRRGRAGDGLLLTAVVTFALTGGHPGTQLHVLAATALYALLRTAVMSDEPTRERIRRLGLIGAALALGALVTAVVTLPAQLAAQDTAGALARAQGSVEFRGSSMSAEILRTALFPDWWGRPSEHIRIGPANYNERTLYAGSLAAILALVALVSPGGWRRKLPFATLGALGALVAVRAPIVHPLVSELPLFDRVQNQRMVLWWAIAVALLAAFGLQALLERPRRWRTWGALAALAGLAGMAVASLRYEREQLSHALNYVRERGDEASETVLALASVGWFVIFAAAFAVILALACLRPSARRLVGALVVLVAALDMLHFAHGYQPMPPADKAVPPRTPALAYLQRHAGEERIGAYDQAVAGDAATLYGLRDVRGYDQPQPSLRFYNLWRTTHPEQRPGAPFFITNFAPATVQLLGMLGMRFLLTPPEADLTGHALLEPVYRGYDATIFRNRGATPRAFVAQEVVAAHEETDEIGLVVAAEYDARRRAVVRSDELGGLRLETRGGRGEVRLVRDEDAEVVLRASLTRASLVVLADASAPGWTVEIDGKSARALQTNVVLRGVVAPAGEHEIVWRFHVPGLRAGALLSLLGVLACAAWGGVIVARRRRLGREAHRGPA